MRSVYLWKAIMPALGLAVFWTAFKKEDSATRSTQPQSQLFKRPVVLPVKSNAVDLKPLVLPEDFSTTAKTAQRPEPATNPIGTTTPTTSTIPTPLPTPRPSTDTITTTTLPPTDATVITPAPALPSNYSLAMPPVRYQGTEGSCVAFAVAYTRACEQYYKTGAVSYSDASNIFSPEYIFNQVRPSADGVGSVVTTSLDLLKNQGVCTWQTMPYNAYNGCSVLPDSAQMAEAGNYKITSYSKIISSDLTAIKKMIAGKHPVIASFTVDQSFYDATPGFIWRTLTGNKGSHTMVLCGYDDAKHAFKAINSWGTAWGDEGYIWIDYNLFPVTSSYYTYVMTL